MVKKISLKQFFGEEVGKMTKKPLFEKEISGSSFYRKKKKIIAL